MLTYLAKQLILIVDSDGRCILARVFDGELVDPGIRVVIDLGVIGKLETAFYGDRLLTKVVRLRLV